MASGTILRKENSVMICEDNNLEEGLISVIVPVYNAGAYLHSCFDSIVRQTYDKLDIILINDGSTDESADICQCYADKDSRIRVLHTGNNGPAAARNEGLALVRSQFVYFADADDTLEANALHLLIEKYTQHRVDLVIGDFRRIKHDAPLADQTSLLPDSRCLTQAEVAAYARSYLNKPNRFLMFAYAWGRLFRTKLIRDHSIVFNRDLHTFEDVAFNFDYLCHVDRVYYLRETLYNHVIQEGYTSATMTIGHRPLKMFGYLQALVNVGAFIKCCDENVSVERDVGHGSIFLTIIQMVRISGQVTRRNWRVVRRVMRHVLRQPEIRDNIKYYVASKGDSKVIPFFMRLGWVGPIMLVCKYKALRRYGRSRSV